MADTEANSEMAVSGESKESKAADGIVNGDSNENKVLVLIDDSKTNEVAEIAPARATLQKLYETQAACGCCTKWSEKYPEAVTEAVKLAEAGLAHSNVLRYAEVHDTLDGNPRNLDSIVVQSPELKKNVGVVLAKYPGIKADVTELILRPPSQLFFYRWELLQRLKDEVEGKALEEVLLLIDALDPELKPALIGSPDLLSRGNARP